MNNMRLHYWLALAGSWLVAMLALETTLVYNTVFFWYGVVATVAALWWTYRMERWYQQYYKLQVWRNHKTLLLAMQIEAVRKIEAAREREVMSCLL